MKRKAMIKRNNGGKISVIGFDVSIKHHFADGKDIFGTDEVAVGRQRDAAAFVGDHGLPAVPPLPGHHVRTGFVHGMTMKHAMPVLRILLTHKGRVGVMVMRMADSGLTDRRRETKCYRHQ